MQQFKVSDERYIKFSNYEVLLYDRTTKETIRRELTRLDDQFSYFMFMEFIQGKVTRLKLQRILYSFYAGESNKLKRKVKNKKKVKTNAVNNHGIIVKNDKTLLRGVKKCLRELREIMFDIKESENG